MSMRVLRGRHWFGCAVIVFCVFVTGSALAGPRILEEQTRLEVPGPSDQLIANIGFDGDHLMVATRRNFTDEGSLEFLSEMSVHVFQRTASNQWRYVSTLAHDLDLWEDAFTMWVALEGNVAVVQGRDLKVFEYSAASGWKQTAVLPAPPQQSWHGSVVKLDHGTLIAGGAYCAWQAYRKNSQGRWASVGQSSASAGANCFADLDVSGDTIVAGAGDDFYTWNEIRIYPRLASTPSTIITSPFGSDPYFGRKIALEGDTLLTISEVKPGVHVFRQPSGGSWQFAGTAATADALWLERDYNVPYLELSTDWIVGAYPFDSQRAPQAGSIPVFKRNANGTPTEIARLLASDARENLVLGISVAISGRRVAASAGYGGSPQVYIFELPADLSQRAITQDDFESGNYSRWTPITGSSLTVATTSRSKVLRQSSLAGDAGAVLTNADWKDQSIQADVRATAVQGNDRWFGLIVRHSDPGNYYYLTLRSSNTLSLRSLVNGQIRTLATVSLPMTLNRDYRLRLEAVGTWIRAYVDGELLAEARDSTHKHGQMGIAMYRTSAEYDNIVVTPNPQLTLLAEDFSYNVEKAWTVVDGNWTQEWSAPSNLYSYRQRSATGDARVVTGVSTRDQIVEVNTRVLSFAAPSGWIGMMGRYVDNRNYYYVTLRQDGTVSLRKLVNGAIHVLGTAPLSTVVGDWKNVRFELIGDALRVYCDNRILLQARDSTFARGRYGLVTYRATAEYGEFIARQP